VATLVEPAKQTQEGAGKRSSQRPSAKKDDLPRQRHAREEKDVAPSPSPAGGVTPILRTGLNLVLLAGWLFVGASVLVGLCVGVGLFLEQSLKLKSDAVFVPIIVGIMLLFGVAFLVEPVLRVIGMALCFFGSPKGSWARKLVIGAILGICLVYLLPVASIFIAYANDWPPWVAPIPSSLAVVVSWALWMLYLHKTARLVGAARAARSLQDVALAMGGITLALVAAGFLLSWLDKVKAPSVLLVLVWFVPLLVWLGLVFWYLLVLRQVRNAVARVCRDDRPARTSS
jgi:hypothetical protein